MISFEQEVQKIVIEHGVAADRLNKALNNLCMEMYLHGFRDCDVLHKEGTEYNMSEVTKKVTKTMESYKGVE